MCLRAKVDLVTKHFEICDYAKQFVTSMLKFHKFKNKQAHILFVTIFLTSNFGITFPQEGTIMNGETMQTLTPYQLHN